MARPARIEYEGAFYHVMNRGNRKDNIFLDDNDREMFCKILGNVENRYGIIIYLFVLMSNHYHILLETPFSNLSRAIQRLNGDYALYFSRRHKIPGHIFQGRFKATLVEKDAYLLELSRYIHLNPLRAGLARKPEEYKWSSLPSYIKGRSNLPFILHWDWILSIFGKTRSVALKRYKEYVYGGIRKCNNPGRDATGGWILGSERWAKEISKKFEDSSSDELSGVKPLKIRIPVSLMEKHICNEFGVGRDEFRKRIYDNRIRMAVMYLTVQYCGLPLREAGQRYGGVSYSAVGKAIGRFRARLAEDSELSRHINNIISNVQM